MTTFKRFETVYVNGDMDGRTFYDLKGSIEKIDESNSRRTVYLIKFLTPCPDGQEQYWYVRKNNLSHKPLHPNELEIAGITKFWKEFNI